MVGEACSSEREGEKEGGGAKGQDLGTHAIYRRVEGREEKAKEQRRESRN